MDLIHGQTSTFDSCIGKCKCDSLSLRSSSSVDMLVKSNFSIRIMELITVVEAMLTC